MKEKDREKKASKHLKNELFIKNFFISKNFLTILELFCVTRWLQKTNKHEPIYWNHKLFRKNRSIKAIKFNSIQRKSMISYDTLSFDE